jgi:hypothetical protein
MSKPTPAGAPQRTDTASQQAAAAPSAQRAGEVLRDTIEHLEEACARAGTGDIADRLRIVCDRLRSAQAALGPDAPTSAGGCLPEQGACSTANETEPY